MENKYKDVEAEEQAGFKTARSTVDHLFCITQVIKNKMAYGPKLQNRVDLQKALTKGLSVGNPLSPLMVDIFMDHLENNRIFGSANQLPISHWFRYVDDVFAIIRSDNIDHNIQFRIEMQVENTLSLLDLQLSIDSRHLASDIYRKPTQPDHLIKFNSNHPFEHKMAAHRSYVYRLLQTPL
ncbi:hypothetical protein HUJ05_002143 [Dendroctonus ponderosae]|nr:hypothetical protein HUJ05_002143 [Dendroctonus ponderosae]